MKKKIILLTLFLTLALFSGCANPTKKNATKKPEKETVTTTVTTEQVTTQNTTTVTTEQVTTQNDSASTKTKIKKEAFFNYTGIENRQVFDKTDATVLAALNQYKQILTNQASYICFQNTEYTLANQATNLSLLTDIYRQKKLVLTEFTIIDLDGDSIPEVILSFEQEGFPFKYVIFRYIDNNVYMYTISYRQLRSLNIDGTYHPFSTGHTAYICTLTFSDKTYSGWSSNDIFRLSYESDTYYINGEVVTEGEWYTLLSYYDNKPAAAWYEFSDENINKYFPES